MDPAPPERNRIAVWLWRYPVIAFYVLVFGLSWPAMYAAFFAFPHNEPLQALAGLIATFSPVLVALLISTITAPAPRYRRSPSRWVVFGVAWVIAWLVLVLHTWQVREAQLTAQTVIPTGIVAILPGWLISGAHSRLPGVRNLFRTLLHPSGNVIWYVVALFTVPAIQVIGAGITRLGGGDIQYEVSDMSVLGAAGFISLTFLYGFLFSGGINEETGWRGFVLPRLQARWPVIIAVTIVWFFWALWHLPYDIALGTPLRSLLFNRIVLNFVWAVLFAWVYNRTGGSLLAPALFHPAMNAFGDSLPRTDAATVLFVILAIVVIISERMWTTLPGRAQTSGNQREER
jgi:membrane protease YdiL (CAAX protease family)